nr:unnamed protein product [Spirometra erinaceieuropaei]
MARKLNFLREGSRTSINSASQFLADIRGKVVRPEQIMVSFDVVSLFTSIPPDLARDVLRKRLEENYDETNKPLKIDHLLQLFAFCQQTFFTFNGRTYEQIKGTPMGSPISSLVAELVLQELENVAFDHYEPAFWRRYVDDTFVIIERSRLADFQDLLNGIFPDIQFTREEEHAEQLPFLDVLITRTPNGELNTTVYRKATNTTQILNYHSNHPMAHKRSCVRTLFQRADIGCTAADLVFGTSLRPPGDYVEQLRSVMRNLRATPPRASPANSFIPPGLDKRDFVLVRHDAVRRPFKTPYDGPYKVFRRSDKDVVIDRNGKTDTVSIDRVKPAHINDCDHSSPQHCTPPQTVMPPPTGDSPPPVRRTRSGRHVHWPDRFVAD